MFHTFLERKAASQVVRLWRDQGLRLPRRHRNGETVWRTPTVAAVIAILPRNPAYAGAFVYGKTRTQMPVGGGRSQQRRLPLTAWKVIVHDRYPAYVTWETFVRIQAMVDDNDTAYAHNPAPWRAASRAALLQGIVYCGPLWAQDGGAITRGGISICVTISGRRRTPQCVNGSPPILSTSRSSRLFSTPWPQQNSTCRHALAQRQQQQAALDQAQRYKRSGWSMRRTRRAVATSRSILRIGSSRRNANVVGSRLAGPLRGPGALHARLPRTRSRQGTADSRTARGLQHVGAVAADLWSQDTLSRAQRKALLRCLLEGGAGPPCMMTDHHPP